MTDVTQTLFMPALATAEWWADKVFGGAVGDHGGDGLTVALSVLAGAQGNLPAGSKRVEFVQRLTEHVERFVQQDRERERPFGLCLSTDYGPEGVLANLADEFRLGGSFPWKTMTWTYSTHVTAALGYGASAVLVWQADDWERPACGQGKWGEEDREPWKCSALRYHEGAHVFDTPDPLCQLEVDVFGRVGPCLRPVGHDWHVDDDYSAKRHAFTA